MILILPVTTIFVFDKIYTCILGIWIRSSISLLFFTKTYSVKIACFVFSRKSILILKMLIILRARLHKDLIVTSYEDGWHLIWYQLKEET